MKICDVVQFYSPLGGGVRRYILDKVHHLAQYDEVSHAVIIPSDRNDIDSIESTNFYHVKSMLLPGSLSYRALLNRDRIYSVLNEIQPNLLEVGDPYRSAWLCLKAAQSKKIPIVAFYHSDFPRALGRTIHKYLGYHFENWIAPRVESYVVDLYNRMSATVVASQRLEKVLRDIGIQKLVRIPLGTNIHVFRPIKKHNHVREQLQLKDNTRLLLFVGRLAREKNITSLVGMMDELKRKSPGQEYHLLLVGDGEQRRKVEHIIANREDITWYKYCNSVDELATYYTAADVFVHAGCYETFGITSLEAQACGTPVLAVKQGGLDDTLMGEEDLVMAQSHKPADLAYGVESIIETNPQLRADKRRQRMIQNFSIQTTFERMIRLYSHLIKGYSAEDFSIEDPITDDDVSYSPVLTG